MYLKGFWQWEIGKMIKILFFMNPGGGGGVPGADSRKGVPGVRPPKIFKDQGTRGYIYIHIIINMHISRSILK